MKFTSNIEVFDVDIPLLTKCFQVELERLQTKRCEVEFKTEKDSIVFNLKATDSVALRASLNGITKLITTFEKASEV